MRKITLQKGRILLPMTLIVMLCSISITYVSAQDEATVRILESPITIPEEDIGTPFNITVIIENVPEDHGAVGFEFKLFYDTTILDGLNVTLPPDHFMEPDGDEDNLWVLSLDINDAYNATHGCAWVAVTYMDLTKAIDMGYAPKYNNGTLAIITLNSTAPGVTPLYFGILKVGGAPPPPALPPDVLPTTPIHGTVDVIPEFPAFIIPLLFIAATTIAIILRRKSWLEKHKTPNG